MDDRILYFQIGEKDRLTIKELRGAILRIAGLLADLDAAVSHDPRGTLRWEVAVLRKDSPALLGLDPVPIARREPGTKQLVRRDTAPQVERILMSGLRALASGERPENVPDAAIEKVERLAAQSKKIGDIKVYTNVSHAEIGEATLEGIKKVAGKNTRSKGSILGQLDTIAVHYGNEIRVWDENTNRAVRCSYPDDIEDQVKSLLRERVLVVGEVAFNAKGHPISVRVERVDQYGRVDDLPTIEEMSGLLKNPTGDLSLKDHMEQLRDG